VTHPDMKRYFMLTSEAVLLVMQAAALGRGGEVFVLDMGRPVRILDLAKAMIRHAGLQPDVDIPIMISGRRPGEKLFEELLTAEEGTVATLNQRIRQARISKQHSYPELMDGLRRLAAAVRTQDPEMVRLELIEQVATFQPDPGSTDGRPTASGRAQRLAEEVGRSGIGDGTPVVQRSRGSGTGLMARAGKDHAASSQAAGGQGPPGERPSGDER
jgi:hypothetical protein